MILCKKEQKVKNFGFVIGLMEILHSLIKEDNAEEVEKLLNSYENLRNNFNTLHNYQSSHKVPLLQVAVESKCKKVVKYFLSQDFIDKTICTPQGRNIYHVICSLNGEEIFSMIEKNVSHNIIFDSKYAPNAFHIALCNKNNLNVVKRVYEILESLNVDLTSIKSLSLHYALKSGDIDIVKYVSLIDGVNLRNGVLQAIGSSTFDIVVYLLNLFICQAVPSHLHNQFHIFQFLNPLYNLGINLNKDISNINDNKNEIEENNIINNDTKKENGLFNNKDYLELVEEDYQKLLNLKEFGNRIWHVVCKNANLNVVQLIFSLKGIQPHILNSKRENLFLLACEQNSNIKIIKFLHKLFPSFIHSQLNRMHFNYYTYKEDEVTENRASLVFKNENLEYPKY